MDLNHQHLPNVTDIIHLLEILNFCWRPKICWNTHKTVTGVLAMLGIDVLRIIHLVFNGIYGFTF